MLGVEDWDNGNENGNYYSIIGYILGLYWSDIEAQLCCFRVLCSNGGSGVVFGFGYHGFLHYLSITEVPTSTQKNFEKSLGFMGV